MQINLFKKGYFGYLGGNYAKLWTIIGGETFLSL